MGQVIVNLPVTVAIIISFFSFWQLGLPYVLSIILSSGVGWFFWGKLLEKWKMWALNNGVERDRLFKLGKIGLINFYRHRIFD